MNLTQPKSTRASHLADATVPFITVIVPVKNEAKAIAATLGCLFAQDYPADAFEVIVADGGSTDETVPIVRRFQAEWPNLKLLFNPVGYSSGARNLGVIHMRGDYIVIVDGHCQIQNRRYLQDLANAFEKSGADSLGRPQPLNAPSPSLFQQAVSVARASKLGHNPGSDIFSDQPKFVEPQSTAIAYRREIFPKIGLFDESFDACEDVELNHRVHAGGLSCYFVPELKIEYHPRASLSGLFYQLSRYGRGRARLAAKHPGSLTLPALVPPLWLIFLTLGPLAALVWVGFFWAYLAVLSFYLLAITAESVRLGRSKPFRVAGRLPLIFMAIHAGFGWGFLREAGKCLRQSR